MYSSETMVKLETEIARVLDELHVMEPGSDSYACRREDLEKLYEMYSIELKAVTDAEKNDNEACKIALEEKRMSCERKTSLADRCFDIGKAVLVKVIEVGAYGYLFYEGMRFEQTDAFSMDTTKQHHRMLPNLINLRK